MKSYLQMNKEELAALREDLCRKYEDYKEMGLSLDMSRGKPSLDQMALSMGMFVDGCDPAKWMTEDGIDCRNYGMLEGVPQARRLMAAMMDCDPDQIIIGGNSSLNMMYDVVMRAKVFGILGNKPWGELPLVHFLCPVPGYDRHFKILEELGINMINVPMTEDGPDMDMVERLVTSDPMIKGIWCVPKFSNPTGTVYSDETVRRLAAMKPAAKDFRIFWDNAYAVHYLYEDNQPQILDILKECAKAGHPDMVYEFASTSKVTMSGAGIAAFASSPKNVAEFKKRLSVQTIGYDKLNMLRHVNLLKDEETLKAHMMKHAAIIRPKFETVEEILEEELGGLEIGSWNKPLGGYFISFQARVGCAKKIVEYCKNAGVVMTGAGAAFPYGKDPQDSNIRIAPTYPGLNELKIATRLFALCVKLVTVDKLIQELSIDPIIKEVFTQEDYDAIMALEEHHVKEFYETKPAGDYIVKVTHKPQRFRRERMLYIVQLNGYHDNLVNDDMYWRAEPKKFFAGTPTLQQIWDALQENLDYFRDKKEFHMSKLNLTFDKIEFDS